MAMSIYLLTLSGFYTQSALGTQSNWDTTALWEDNFNTFDTTYWTKGRNEASAPTHIQWYSDSNVVIESGKLVIKSHYGQGNKHNNDAADWVSGAITTEDKRTMLPPVKIEVVAKLPVANLHDNNDHYLPRLHTAIWLQRDTVYPTGSTDWTDPVSGRPVCYQEYDMMEQWDGRYTSRVSAAYHFNNAGGSQYATCDADSATYERSDGNLFKNYEHTPAPSPTYDGYWPFKPTPAGYDINTFSDGYTNWTLEWEEDALRLWINDTKVSDIDTSDGYMPYQPMALIINTALDDRSWSQRPAADFDHTDATIVNTFSIDYVGVFKPVGWTAATAMSSPTDHFWSLSNGGKDSYVFNIYQMIEMNVLVSALVTMVMLCCFVCILKRCYWEKKGYAEVKFEDENENEILNNEDP